MARKITGLQRVLDAPALFSVAYGEIASSIYIALGIIALHALGLTPEVLRARRRALPGRRALVRRGHDRDPGDRRRRHVRPPRVQRPRRLPHRLGALPRLPDRDRALGAFPAALPRRGDAVGLARAQPVGRGRRRRASCSGRRPPARAPLGLLPLRDLRRRARPADPAAARRARLRASSSPATRSRTASRSARTRAGTRSCSRCRWRCSPTPGSRRSRTSPRRRASPGATCRAASSPGSASSC